MLMQDGSGQKSFSQQLPRERHCRLSPTLSLACGSDLSKGTRCTAEPGPGLAGDQLGRALELQVQPLGGAPQAKHSFAFDRVFGPASTQVRFHKSQTSVWRGLDK